MAPSRHDLESRIAKLEVENLQLRGQVANLNQRLGRLENAFFNGKQSGKSVGPAKQAGKVKSAEDLQKRISSLSTEIQHINSAFEVMNIQNQVDGASSKVPRHLTSGPGPDKQIAQKFKNNGDVYGKEFNDVEFAMKLHSQLNDAFISRPGASMMDAGPNSSYLPPRAERVPTNLPNGVEACKGAYVPPKYRPMQQQPMQVVVVPGKHRADALKSESNESFPELNAAMTRKELRKINAAAKLKKEEKEQAKQKAKKAKPADGSCQKMCEANEHPCGKFHALDKPCPPCKQTLTGLKLKCNHKYDIPCHRRNKIADVCSECDSKAKSTTGAAAAAVPLNQISTSIGVNHIPCPDEMILSKFREYLAKFAGTSNLEDTATELSTLIQRDVKYVPVMAHNVIETAVSDTEQQPRHYALLISKLTKRSSSEATGFHDQLISFMSELCVLAFTSNEASPRIKAMLQRKPMAGMDPKSRNNSILKLMGALYWEDVVTTAAIVSSVLAPLLDAPTNETLDYFCKLLLMIGSKLEKGVRELASSDKASDVDNWYENAFVQLEKLSAGTDISAATKQAIQNILSLKGVNWDKYQLTVEAAPEPQAAVFVAPPARPLPTPVMLKPKKNQKKCCLSEENVLAFAKVQSDSVLISAQVTSSSTNITDDNDWLDIDLDDDIMDPLAAAYVPFKYSDSDSETVPSRAPSVTKVQSKASSRASSVAGAKVTSTSSTSSRASSSQPAQLANLNPVESRAVAEVKNLAKLPVNANAFFKFYAKYDNSLKKTIRKELLKIYFKKGVNISDFVRDLSMQIHPGSNNAELAAMGHLLELMKELNLIDQHNVLVSFVKGAVQMISSYATTQLISVIGNVAYALVSIFNDHHENFNWVADLYLMTNKHDLGRTLVIEILNKIHGRVGMRRFGAAWCATRPQHRKHLEALNVQSLLRSEPMNSLPRRTLAVQFNGAR